MSWARVRLLSPVMLRLAAALTLSAAGVRRRPRRPHEPLSAAELRAHWPGLRSPGPSRVWRSGVVAVLTLVLLGAGAVYGGYQLKFAREARARAIALTAGDPDLGRRLTRRYGCARCHTIPGVPGADGQVGPSLAGVAARVYIAGVATNTPDSLIQWIVNPRSLNPKTAMPVTGISPEEARHVAAYLYTLR
jgi:cytochrome c2